jgi:hypothetical protein
MSGPAQVRSTPAIEKLQEALARFEKRVQAALDTLDGEMHRTEDWLEHDRPAHWKRELHEAEDQLHAAKMDLERCLMMVVAGQRPACREQKAAVDAAKQRLEYCQQKRDVIRHWQRDFRHESLEYRGRIGQLRRLLEHDIPKARALLVKIVRRLEDYQVERPPEAMFKPEEASAAPGATRAAEPIVAAGKPESDKTNENGHEAPTESAPGLDTPNPTPAGR